MISTRKLAIELTILGVVVALLALLGPFGTYVVPLGQRFVDWMLFVFGGYLFFRPILAASDALASQSGLPRWIALGAACLFASLPTTLLVLWVLAGRSLQQISVGSLVALYPQVVIVGAMVIVVQMILSRRAGVESGQEQATEPQSNQISSAQQPVAEENVSPLPLQLGSNDRNALVELLPAHLGTDIICLENEDHYIRVHTNSGNALVLMRMRDAVAHLSAIDGERVHRGWWVARPAFEEVVRRGRATSLRLKSGIEVPVARTLVASLRDKGWF